MKRSSLRILVLAFFLGAAALSMTSCNKGYGCPTDFSLGCSDEAPAQMPGTMLM
ncbi:MAG: hypothetical protein R3330_03410 [Saprospiraceae bacterium]|nr:hypothetical protein [Saprospiraceae bacterium]